MLSTGGLQLLMQNQIAQSTCYDMLCALTMQEVYCFILPFVIKWVVAALVVSVLVSLFSRLRRQGDHSHSSILAQIHSLLLEGWQRLFRQAPSNQNMLLTLFRVIGRGRTFRALPTSVR